MNVVWKIPEITEPECLYHCYLVKINKKGRNKYMGSKIGYPDGTYEGSVVTHALQYKKDLMNYESEYQVIFTGTEAECRNHEQNYLKGKDAKMNKEYYNESNSGAFLGESKEFLEVLEGLDSRTFEIINTPLKVILSWLSHQVRSEDGTDTKHVSWLYDKLIDTSGKYWKETLSEKSLIALEDFDGKNKHRRLGKNHTCAAGKRYFGAESDVTLPVILVPKKLWKKLSDDELQEIGQLDNRQLNFKPKEQDETSIINNLVNFCKNKNKKHDDPVITTKLKRHGFVGGKIKSLKASIKKQLIKPTGLAPNEKFVSTSKEDARQKSINYCDIDTHCIPVSSGMFRSLWSDWISSLENSKNIKKNLVVLYYHPNIDSWNNFKNDKDKFQKKVKDFNNFLKVTGSNDGNGLNIEYREINPVIQVTLQSKAA
jgi:hypothetical protein